MLCCASWPQRTAKIIGANEIALDATRVRVDRASQKPKYYTHLKPGGVKKWSTYEFLLVFDIYDADKSEVF